MITWITENVAIGEYLDVVRIPERIDAVEGKLLKVHKVDCVLSLRGSGLEDIDGYNEYERKLCKSNGIDFYRVPIMEDDDKVVKIQLKSAAYMLELLSQKYKRILVHCTAGIDRAPFVVAYWLAYNNCVNMEWNQKPCKKCIPEWYKEVKHKRPQIIEHMEWI